MVSEASEHVSFIFVFSPELHPFQAEREYTRALNAVKLEKVFAKPFICALDGHRDGLTAVAKHPKVDTDLRVFIFTHLCLVSVSVHDMFS